jgi:hypothetical protein
MSSPEALLQPSNHFLSVVVALLGSDALEVIPFLWRLGKRILSRRVHEGMYEALEYDAQLELLDTKGEKAVFHKRERVRYLQDNIVAYLDKAWGDGNIFADYRCSPGVVVDRYKEGYRWYVLISLRETKHRNEVDEFRIERTIHRGFMKPVENFQIDIDHVTRKFRICVVFPRKRHPKQVVLVEQNSTHSIALTGENRLTLPDGRQQYVWSTNKPRLFEGYILRWEW